MSDLEKMLRDALRRHEPGPGFAERVLARAGQPQAEPDQGFRQRLARPFRRTAFGLALATAACLALIVGVQHERQRAKAEAARQDVLLALEVTSQALDSVREQVRRSSSGRQSIVVSPGILTGSKEKP